VYGVGDDAMGQDVDEFL